MNACNERTSQVSLIIPACNAQAYLAATLESVLNQTEPTWRAVIVDDGSTDGTAAIANSFVHVDPRFGLVQQVNKGVASARNRGIELSDGEFLLFLDADDISEPDVIESCKRSWLTTPMHQPCMVGPR